MSKIYTSIRAIKDKAFKIMEKGIEGTYFTYSPPDGMMAEIQWEDIARQRHQMPLKDIMVPADGSGRQDRLFFRGHREGEGFILTEDDKPVLTLRK